MAKYLTNKETQAILEKIIRTAEKTLILVSPYIVLTGTLFTRIKAAGEKGVRIKIIYRADQVKKEQLDRLKGIKNIDLKLFWNTIHITLIKQLIEVYKILYYKLASIAEDYINLERKK